MKLLLSLAVLATLFSAILWDREWDASQRRDASLLAAAASVKDLNSDHGHAAIAAFRANAPWLAEDTRMAWVSRFAAFVE